MLRQRRKIFPFYIVVDLIFIGLICFYSYISRYNLLKDIIASKAILPNFREYSFIFILWAVFLVISLNRRNLYITDRGLSIPKEIFRTIISVFWTGILMSGVIFFAKYQFFSRHIFLKSFLLLCFTLPTWRVIKRLLLRKLIAQGYSNKNVLIVGVGKIGKLVWQEIQRSPHLGLRVIGFLDDNGGQLKDGAAVIGKLTDFFRIAKKHFIDEVIITIPSEKKVISNLIEQAKGLRLGVKIVPENFEQALPMLEVSYLGMMPLLTYKERSFHPAEVALKRLFDFVVSLLFLTLLSPLFIIVAILVKLDSRGPMFYVQKRVGYRRKPFNFYKFRSMVKEAESLKTNLMDKNESKGNVIFKIKKDPRVTRIGKFLRKYSIDEFPQMFNVLKGDMSLVGPRPFPVEESQKLDSDHLERFMVRPGITGLAQIKGRSDLSFYHWGKWDLWYVSNWSFGLDFLILWKTIPVVFKAKGAY
ncbi:MAG: sugar transferase [Candidatus Omnitrophica bacterium]|nr:sugar transferase [Candidatus Omnitrophota bacterium]